MSTDPDWAGRTDPLCEHSAEKQQKGSGSIMHSGEEWKSKWQFSSKTISDVTCNRCGWSAKGMASARGTSKGLGGMQPRNVIESDRLKNGWFWPVSAGRVSSSLSLSVAPKHQRFLISFHSYKSKGYKLPKINILPS